MEEKSQENYLLGIELEVIVPFEGYDKLLRVADNVHTGNTPFAFGSDGSIHSESKGLPHEIRGIKPFTFKELVPAITKLSEQCEEAKVFVNASCGFHLHISTEKFFNPLYLKRLIMTWVAIEDVLVATQPASRMNNGYCQRYLAQYLDHEYSQFKFSRAKKKLISDLSMNSRRNALNLHSLSKHGSIEIRLHAGTTNAEKIINWARLITAIAEYSFKKYDSEKIHALFRQEISEDKINAVFIELGLSQELSDYYKARIEKHLFKSLAKHNKAALSNLDMLLKIREEEKKLKLKTRAIKEAVEKEQLAHMERMKHEQDQAQINTLLSQYYNTWEIGKRDTLRQEVSN